MYLQAKFVFKHVRVAYTNSGGFEGAMGAITPPVVNTCDVLHIVFKEK